MRRYALLLVLPLAGCQTVGTLPADQLATICQNAPLIDAVVSIAASSGKLKASTVRVHRQAMAVVATVCASPPKDAAAALATAARAYANMLDAKRAAEVAERGL